MNDLDVFAIATNLFVFCRCQVVFGGPYLIWRLLSSIVPQPDKPAADWVKHPQAYVAVALHPFKVIITTEVGATCLQHSTPSFYLIVNLIFRLDPNKNFHSHVVRNLSWLLR